MITQIKALELYDTGLVSLYESNELRFHWYSWLYCEISWASSNPIHYCICTDFGGNDFRKLGIMSKPYCDIWNSSYEPEHMHQVKLSRLFHWKPLSIVQLEK